jgi:hypothetical protein
MKYLSELSFGSVDSAGASLNHSDNREPGMDVSTLLVLVYFVPPTFRFSIGDGDDVIGAEVRVGLMNWILSGVI